MYDDWFAPVQAPEGDDYDSEYLIVQTLSEFICEVRRADQSDGDLVFDTQDL